MTNDFERVFDAAAETQDYTGGDGLLYCGSCRTPKQFRMDKPPMEAVNAMYMYEAVDLIKEAAAEIPNGDALWFADDRTRTAASKNGVLEQVGRMRVQDGFSDGDCIYIANLAADAVNGGFTSREVERTIRAIRLAFKAKDAHTDDPYYADLAARAVDMLRRMAAYETKGAAND